MQNRFSRFFIGGIQVAGKHKDFVLCIIDLAEDRVLYPSSPWQVGEIVRRLCKVSVLEDQVAEEGSPLHFRELKWLRGWEDLDDFQEALVEGVPEADRCQRMLGDYLRVLGQDNGEGYFDDREDGEDSLLCGVMIFSAPNVGCQQFFSAADFTYDVEDVPETIREKYCLMSLNEMVESVQAMRDAVFAEVRRGLSLQIEGNDTKVMAGLLPTSSLLE